MTEIPQPSAADAIRPLWMQVYLPNLVIATGQGAWEDVDASWDAGAVLGGKGLPNRVDVWGQEWAHDWPT